jgi:adenylate cyclase
VKHTGDGIMASFNNVANSVEAAIFIMRKVTAENATSKIPLGLKIGINAGEPIVEDDDLFGTTVQLSARICDKATNHQVLVSETVKGICQGKSMSFTARGTREMKGFKEPIPLYEAVWQEAGAAAA